MYDSSEVQPETNQLGNDQYRTFVSLVPFMIAVPGLIIVATLCFWFPLSEEPYSIVFSIFFTILIFDLPVCLVGTISWLTTGKLPVFSLTPLIPCREEREFHRSLKKRPKLNDDEFYETFYVNCQIPKQLVVQLRTTLEAAYGQDFGGLHPNDNLIYADCEIDLFDVIFRVSREFDIVIPDDRIDKLDGTFDSLLRCISEISSCTEDN